MGSDHRINLGILLALGLSSSMACRKTPPPGTVSTAPSASASAPDRLAPGEIPPGQQTAHDLLLPRGGTVDRKFGTSVYCTVPLPPESFANWVRKQSDEADALVGPSGTIFTTVRVKGAAPGHHLRIEITPGPHVGESSAVVDMLPDAPPPQVAPTSNEEAMKKAGLTPDGKWLDPKHLE
ncbi:MAG: hypothetical protein ACXWUG_01430 [Polyangiales bacterium]